MKNIRKQKIDGSLVEELHNREEMYPHRSPMKEIILQKYSSLEDHLKLMRNGRSQKLYINKKEGIKKMKTKQSTL